MVELLLGDGTHSQHQADDILPVFRLRRERLLALIADRRLEDGAAGTPIAWGDDRGDLRVLACGRCATCDGEVIAHRDLLLVAGMRPVQRDRLRAGGIRSIDDLVAATTAPARMSQEVFQSLRTQARLQLTSPAGGVEAVAPDAEGPAIPNFDVVMPTAIAALPLPDVGDIFFDFEGDPLYTEPSTNQWGIDYLFGWVDVHDTYTALWAHSFADEKRALEEFLDVVALRRQAHPGMHIYHYAPYETAHLLAMTAAYGVREAQLATLLRDGVFVDLYPIVRRSLRVGSRSYSIKKLEPLYMGADVRTSDVQRGDDSIVKYVEAGAARDTGDDATADAILADLADYNRYDCVSTRRLRNWLIAQIRGTNLRPAADEISFESVYEPTPRAEALLRWAAERPAESDDAAALRLGSAAIDYYRREAATFWQAHFFRLREPVSEWSDTRDVVVVDAGRSRVLTDWHTPDGARTLKRVIELRGDVAPGTKLSEGSQPFALYDTPAPFSGDVPARAIYAPHGVRVADVFDDGVVIEESAVHGETWDALPIALTPASPPSAGSQQAAIDEWADGVLAASPDFPDDAATDLLRRRPPRTRSGSLTHTRTDRDDSDVDDIVTSLLDLDHSYLAIQGPPGTGKTYVGSHAVARLVAERGFRVGVVAQSHDVVENMLNRIVEAGLPKNQVAKAPKGKSAATGAEKYTLIAKQGVAAFTAENPGGYVVGGTAWDLTHTGRFPRGSLDLLVIDEAGQFSLASTIAVAASADRLLLLGDPQQLPQVSQGTHPEPVDTSALGWVMQGQSVIRDDMGFFLAKTRRMRPEVAGPVSHLSYEGQLAADDSTRRRTLAGIAPGVLPLPLVHEGNATSSPEEAQRVVELVADLVGRTWTDPLAENPEPRPLTPRDIIVVTPYNAQQVVVQQALIAAGFADTPVGTVDKFQGQEAAVSIVSLAASSGRDAPRGLEFLLLQNRLNVAISRAQHTAYIVYAHGLLDGLPPTPEAVARLSAFARLVGAGTRP